MFFFFILLLLILFFVGLGSRSCRNPYKLIYIFGLKGSGKSTLMVDLMIKDLKKGWEIYSNIPDIRLPCRVFDPKDLSDFKPVPHSALYIDEAGLLWDNRNFKTFAAGLTEFYKLQRKYKCKVIINSQTFDVDKKIRDLVDRMYLCSNVAGCFCFVRPILRKLKLQEAMGDSESKIVDNLQFDSIFRCRLLFLPRYFPAFDSYRAPDRAELSFQFVGDCINYKHLTTWSAMLRLLRTVRPFRKAAKPH